MRKIWILLIPTLALCFALGFAIGAFPNQFRQLIGKKSHHLTLLTSEARLVPLSFVLAYEKATGHSVQIKEIPSYHLYKIEAQNADLLFAPLAWLNQFPETLKPLPDEQSLRDFLSNDFQSMKLELPFFLPLLWKTEKKSDGVHLQIWGFSLASDNRVEAFDFLQFLLSNSSRIQDWSNLLPDFRFTLQSSNELKDFSNDQRAQRIRDVSLPTLIIDQKNP
jgi:hypothetical protein